MMSLGSRNSSACIRAGLIGVAAFCAVSTANATVRLSNAFGDHMVLQRDAQTRIWGWADAGEKVTVEFAGQKLTTTADKHGSWAVKLSPMKVNTTPQELTATGSNAVKVSDILVGDVWICSGQSNMAFGLGGCNAPTDIQTANLPLVRYRGYFECFAGSPRKDVPKGAWNVMTPGSAGGCTGVGFYFARKVNKETGIPIGILESTVGGTDIECWMSPESINNYPGNADLAKRYKEGIADWEGKLLSFKAGPGGNRPSFMPAAEQPIGLDVAIPWAAKVRAELTAAGATIDPSFVEFETWMASAKAALTNKTAVPAPPDFGPVGNWLQTTSLSPELKHIPLAPYPQEDRYGINRTGWFRIQSLYNGMIHPLLPFTIKGALWYQGEGNGSEDQPYVNKMGAMIESWRKLWGIEFPFYYVQLPNYGKSNDDPSGGKPEWQCNRMAMFKCLSMPKTGMAVTFDVGDAEDLHPKNKFDVGERLALWALAKDYGKKIVYSGPLYKKMQVGAGKIRISFDSVGRGLIVGKKVGLAPVTEDKGAKLQRFAIAGEDKKWYWADAVIDGKTVVVSSPSVPKPVAVRYAYSQNPAGANLYNKEGIPASPFRTDDW